MANPVPIGVFLDSLLWLDGTPLHIEPYRRRLFEQFTSVDEAGVPVYNLGLFGRGKKNWKSGDGMIAAMFALFDDCARGSQVYVIANDEDQAADDVDLLTKLFRANARLDGLVMHRKHRIERRDGGGFLEVLAAGDAIGAHGKTYRLLVCDEIHGWRNWDLLEALALDPHRADAQMWITSYASLHHKPGVPLFDLMATGKRGDDPRMLFSWYAADTCTDPDLADLSPEQRANPSMASWADPNYLEQQRRRLPAHKFRRLHLNLPGSPEGTALSAESVMDAVDRGVAVRPPVPLLPYHAFVDMSGGSSDDATLAIAHRDGAGRAVLDLVMNQGPRPPFDPNAAVARFAETLHRYGVRAVTGDRYAGETFRRQFEGYGIRYQVSRLTASELYEALEPKLNAHQVVLLDVPTLEQQLLGLVWRGGRIDHPGGEHDDYAAATAGAVQAVLQPAPGPLAAAVRVEALL